MEDATAQKKCTKRERTPNIYSVQLKAAGRAEREKPPQYKENRASKKVHTSDT